MNLKPMPSKISLATHLYQFFLVLIFCNSLTAFSKDFNIVTFGAKADGKKINTRSIQAAIDGCTEQGDRVIVPRGTFVSGTLCMKMA